MLNVELRPLADIRPYTRNPRLNDAAVDAVAESIKQFGWRQPLVVDEASVIVCGDTRYKAAKKLGLTEVPVHVARELSPEQVRAYRLADNATADRSSWNLELLPIELAELQALDVDLSLLGFDADELARLMDPGIKPGLCDPDEIPEPLDEALTKRGDLWLLGQHRLLCGDAGSAEDVDRLLDGAPIHLACCDPPYGVKVEPRSNNAIAAGLSSFGEHGLMHHQSFDAHRAEKRRSASKYHGFDVATGGQSGRATHKKMRPKDRPLVNDHLSDAEFDQRLRAWFQQIGRVLLPGRAFYLWAGWTNLGNYPAALASAELFWHQLLVWVKNAPVLCRKDYMLGYEVCFYGWRAGAAHKWFGPNNARDVWEVAKVPQQKMIHLTQKPTELAVRAIQNSSHPGEHVLDLFGGSGSTLIAAEQTGRRCFMMELDALYADTIVARWEKFSGGKAERVSARSNAPVGAEALGKGT